MSTAFNRSDLEAAVARGERFEYVFFWGHTAPPGQLTDACFSQWFPCEFVVEGERFTTTEQFMMAGKARLFHDEDARARILAERDPMAIKKIGREVRGYVDEAWNAARFDVVVQGNTAKFGQAPALKARLSGTGEKILVEAAPRDTIWGIGLGRDNPRARNPAEWRGSNLLGFALMKARERLRNPR